MTLATPALARRVAVLRFGGVHGSGARARIARALRSRNTVLEATAIPEACEDLGIAMSKGENLARCAKKARAAAVIGGAAKARKLTLVIFSGKTGQVVKTGHVRWSAFPSAKMVRRAMRLVRRGLAKTPRTIGSTPRPTPQPTPRPAAKPDPPDEPGAGGLSFQPDEVSGSKGGETTGAGGADAGAGAGDNTSGGLPSLPDEDPLTAKGRTKPTSPESDKNNDKKKKKEAKANDLRVYGAVGLGLLMRNFSINQPSEPKWQKSYTSGSAFALSLEAAGRPLAFFLDNFAANIFLRLRFSTTLGLKSGVEGSGNSGLSTSIYEFLFDAGYHWNILDKADSPRVDFGLGFGIFDFSVDWGDTPLQQHIPSASYSFLLLGVGGSYPFIRFLGDELSLSAMLRFDYRIVFDAGGVTADDEPGFGPGSTGGLALTLGLKGQYDNAIFGIEYTYTRFFYTFSDSENRFNQKKPSAGGALDQYHAFMIKGGYGF